MNPSFQMGLRRVSQAIPNQQYLPRVEAASQTLSGLSPTDVFSSGTLQLFKSDTNLFSSFLSSIDSSLDKQRERLLDLGCGYGALTLMLARTWGFQQSYGMEIDDDRAAVALER